MNVKITRVRIDRTGTRIVADSEGFVGTACEKAAEPYLRRLGLTMDDVNQSRKPEYHDQQVEQHLGE